MKAGRRPVLVLDEGSRGDVGLVRSLGLAGIPVHLATHSPEGATAASRFVTAVYEFPALASPVEDRIEALRRIVDEIGERPQVMMAGDGTLEFVSGHRDELSDLLIHDLPDADTVDTCFHKDRFAVEAARLGLPVPETCAPRSLDEVEYLAPTLSYPVFVKPFTKEAWGRLPPGVVEATKGQRVDSREELVSLFRSLATYGADAALLQRFVESPDREHYSVHAYVGPDGRFGGAFTTRKIRVYPAHRGIGCLVVSHRVPEIIEASRNVLSKLDYRGFALLQYKRDMASGEFFLLEINCRYSTSGELPARCGANFPAMSHAAMAGEPLPSITQESGPAWLDLERDLASMEEYRALGEWTWWRYLRSIPRVRYGAFFSLDDPGPGLRRLRRRFRSKARSLQAGREPSPRSVPA